MYDFEEIFVMPALSSETIQEITQDPDSLVMLDALLAREEGLSSLDQWQLANRATYPALLNLLALKSNYNRVLFYIALNALTTPETLRSLWERNPIDVISDVVADFKNGLTKNANTPVDILEEASRDTKLWPSLVKNPELPLGIAITIWKSKFNLYKLSLAEGRAFVVWFAEHELGIDYEPSLSEFLREIIRNEVKIMIKNEGIVRKELRPSRN